LLTNKEIEKMNNLISEKEAAERLGVSVATLRRLRYSGDGPDHIKIGGLIKYAPDDLDKFIQANKQTQEG
jgi:predicted DNA-binding transcriptional regulator AlpA